MKEVRQKEYTLIKENLDKLKASGVITQEYYDNELASYQIKKLNLSEVLSYIGVLLLIIGVASFIWSYFEDIGSVGIILIGIFSSILVVFISYEMSPTCRRHFITNRFIYMNKCEKIFINIINFQSESLSYILIFYKNT